MTTSARFQRRKLLRILQISDISRRETLQAFQGVHGLERWLHSEADRAGLSHGRLDAALANLGTTWAQRAVKRFFLSPDAH